MKIAKNSIIVSRIYKKIGLSYGLSEKNEIKLISLNKIKKLFSTISTFILIVFIFTGCSDKKKTNPPYENFIINLRKNPLRATYSSQVPGFYQIFFDQSLGQIYSPFETGYSGMSRLTCELLLRNYSVSLNSLPLNEFLMKYNYTFRIPPITKNKIIEDSVIHSDEISYIPRNSGRVLVLNVAINGKYTVADIINIKKFVHSGGGVLIITEHDNMFGNAEFQNELLKEFDIQAYSTAANAESDTIRGRQWVLCDCPEWNIQDIELYLPAVFHATEPSKVLAYLKKPKNPELKNVAYIREYGGGRIAVLGDAEVLWNMTSGCGSSIPANKIFLNKLFDYLSKHDKFYDKKASIGKNPVYYNKKNKLKAVFDFSSCGNIPLNPFFSLTSLAVFIHNSGYNIDICSDTDTDFSRYDLAVLAVPLIPIDRPERYLKAGRVILIADGQTDIMNDRNLMLDMNSYFKVKYNPAKAVIPINQIAELFGFDFAPVTVIGKNSENKFFADAIISDSEERVKLRRSSVIYFKANDAADTFKILAKTDVNSYISNNATPMQYNNSKNIVFPELESTAVQYPVIIQTEKVFAVADLELFSDQFFNLTERMPAYQLLFEWLRNLQSTEK